jgi:DNA (cytosine-5)-methyltransferase 1
MARIIDEVRPKFVDVENSPMLVGRGLAVVLGDLTEMGYDACWGIVGAADLGAPHQRDRIWIIAKDPRYAHNQEMADTRSQHVKRILDGCADPKIWSEPLQRSVRSCSDGPGRWAPEPGMDRVANGVAYRVDRLKTIGNGQVPIVASTTFSLLSKGGVIT